MSVISQSNSELKVEEGITGKLTNDSALDLLNDETTDVVKKDEVKDKEEEETILEDEEVDEEDESEEKDKVDEEEEKDDDSEDLDLLAEEKDFDLVVPVPKKEILKVYPDLFKKFPHLEVAYYRDRQFVEVFPTVDDAKEASNKAQILDRFDADLSQGNNGPILDAVKRANPEAFNNLVDNYLPSLASIDEKAYFHVTGNLIKEVIGGLAERAKKAEGEEADNLLNAAVTLNKVIFGTTTYEPPKKLGKQTNNIEVDQVKKEREAFNKERFDISIKDSFTRVSNVIQSTVDKNIDKENQFTPYIRKNAVKDVMSSLSDSLDRDETFKRTIINPLIKKASEDGYSRSSMERVEKAYLSRAKSLLPKLIHSAKKEASKGLTGHRNSSSSEDKKGPIIVGHSTSSQNRSGQSRNGSKGKLEIPKGKSPTDWFMED